MPDFAAAHTLPSHDGGCYNLHGHNYGCEVAVVGMPIPGEANRPDASMIIDFTHIKNIYKTRVHDRLDHAMIIGKKLPKWYEAFVDAIKERDIRMHSPKIHVDMLLGKVAHLPIEDTTAECLAEWIYGQMAMGLVDFGNWPSGAGVPEIYSVSVYETDTSIATYFNPRFRPLSTDEVYEAITRLRVNNG